MKQIKEDILLIIKENLFLQKKILYQLNLMIKEEEKHQILE